MKISAPKIPNVVQQVANEVTQKAAEVAHDVGDAFDKAPKPGAVAAALGAKLTAGVEARAKDGTAELAAEANASLNVAGRKEHVVQVGQVGLEGAAAFAGFLGATVGADVSVGVKGAQAGAEAFAGAKLGGELAGEAATRAADASGAVKGEGWVGVGVKTEGGVQTDSSGTTAHAEVGGALGIGGAVGGRVTIKPK